MAENHLWLIFNPQLPSHPHRRAQGLFWLDPRIPPLQPCRQRCHVTAEPSSPQQLCRNLLCCVSAPRQQQFVIPQGWLQLSTCGAEILLSALDRDPLAFFSPSRFLLLFHQTNNLVRLLLLLIFCSLALFHAPFCSQRCLS